MDAGNLNPSVEIRFVLRRKIALDQSNHRALRYIGRLLTHPSVSSRTTDQQRADCCRGQSLCGTH